MRTRFLFLIFILSLVALSGCTARWQELDRVEVRRGVTSSLVDYLYPNSEVPPHDKNIPIPKNGKGKAEIEIFDVQENTSVARITKSDIRQPIIIDDNG